MASIPLAFSIHNFISSVGADAGFAAIIGLAVLVLLYFAHARETANLREEAALLTQRLMQAEARVAQLSRAQPAPAQAATVARPVAVASPSVTALPFAPAGVGAPALAAATHVVPLATVTAEPVPAVPAPPAPRPEPVEPKLPPPPPPPAIPQPAGPEPFEREREPVAIPVAAAPAPATVAGGNGAGHRSPVAPPPVASQAPLPPPQAPRSGAPAGGGPLPPPRGPKARRSRAGRGLGILIGTAGVAAVIAVLLIATSGGTTNPRSSSTPRTTNAPAPRKPRHAAPFSPASVTVAVLNGTNTNQLAHTIGTRLAGFGYKEGALATAANQSEPTTIISYFPGANNRTDALHVAASLKLNSASVRPIDTSTQQVACQGATPCTADVVVTVGADLANS